jgi:biotin carboxyl carrier protein
VIYEITVEGTTYRLELERKDSRWIFRIQDRERTADIRRVGEDVLSLLVEGSSYELRRERTSKGTQIWVGQHPVRVEVQGPRSWRGRKAAAGVREGPQELVAPMPGKVVRILLRPEDVVQAGQGVLVVEAMKMQNEVRSPREGTVRRILVAEGVTVHSGQVLAVVE